MMVCILTLILIIFLPIFFLIIIFFSRKKKVVKSIDFFLPKKWSDLTEDNLIFVSKNMISKNSNSEFLTKCFLHFNNIKVIKQSNKNEWFCFQNGKTFILKEYEVLYFSKKLSFLSKIFSGIKPLKKLAGKTHINTNFEGVSFNQWFYCENYFNAFIYTNDEKHLNSLCSLIYDNNFNVNLMNKKSNKFKKIKFYKKFTVFLFYLSLKNDLSNRFTFLFKKNEQEKDSVPNMLNYLNSMLNILNCGDVTKNNQILNIECYQCFNFLNEKIRENIEIENRLKKMG